MRRRSTLIQFFGSQGLMLLAIIQGIVLVPLYLKYIDAYHYGQWLALGSTVVLLGLIDLGVTGLVTQRVAFFYGSGDIKSLSTFLTTTCIFTLIIAGLILVAGLFLSYWAPNWVGVTGPESAVFQSAFRYATIDAMMMLVVCVFGSILFGIQRPEAHMIGVFSGTILI